MPRGTIPINALTLNEGVDGTAYTIVAADGALIRAEGKTAKLMLRIAITGGTPGTISINAGVNPPAFRQGLGAATVVVPETSGVKYVVIESARFAQANGDIYLDFNAGAVGTVTCLRLPQSV